VHTSIPVLSQAFFLSDRKMQVPGIPLLVSFVSGSIPVNESSGELLCTLKSSPGTFAPRKPRKGRYRPRGHGDGPL